MKGKYIMLVSNTILLEFRIFIREIRSYSTEN